MILIQRAPICKNGPIGVDVTVKSALGPARCFAPTWDMVMGSKRGHITWDEYTARYMAILDGVPESAWEWLKAQADNGVLTVLCYCPMAKTATPICSWSMRAYIFLNTFSRPTNITLKSLGVSGLWIQMKMIDVV